MSQRVYFEPPEQALFFQFPSIGPRRRSTDGKPNDLNALQHIFMCMRLRAGLRAHQLMQ
jgi:hypothetical protein